MGVLGSPSQTLDDELREDGRWQAAKTPTGLAVLLLLFIPLSAAWCLVLPVIGLMWLMGALH